jgi:hypothetical protein
LKKFETAQNHSWEIILFVMDWVLQENET